MAKVNHEPVSKEILQIFLFLTFIFILLCFKTGGCKRQKNLFCIRKITEKNNSKSHNVSRRGSRKKKKTSLWCWYKVEKTDSLIEILVYLLVFYNSVPHPSQCCWESKVSFFLFLSIIWYWPSSSIKK